MSAPSHKKIYLSAVSAEFRSYRDLLASDLTGAHLDVRFQEVFVVTGGTPLVKLADSIQECDAVLHLIGDASGAIPPSAAVQAIHKRYPDLVRRLPALADAVDTDPPMISYTQWEAYLAIYHGKGLYIYQSALDAPRDTKFKLDAREKESQERHLQRMRNLGRYGEQFTNQECLSRLVLRQLLDVPSTRETSTAEPAQWWSKYSWTAGQTAKDESAEVFVSFKNLDETGRETRDCLMAKTVAVFLRRKGFSVFLSVDSLEQLGKSAYMEAIETALQDAKVLIAVGTSADNVNSRWVKYEWHSFHQEIIEGYKKGGEIFSVIDGISERDLPLALRQRQAFRFSEDGLGALSRFLTRSLGREECPS